MKIYTKKGDAGMTGLAAGNRVDKDNLRIEAYGTLDELNSLIGLALTSTTFPQGQRSLLLAVQSDIFTIGGYLAKGIETLNMCEETKALETAIDQMEQTVPPLKLFVLPGGGTDAAHIHLARTVCRKAERRIVSLNKTESVELSVLSYINRLSDYLFVLARYCNHTQNIADISWHGTK